MSMLTADRSLQTFKNVLASDIIFLHQTRVSHEWGRPRSGWWILHFFWTVATKHWSSDDTITSIGTRRRRFFMKLKDIDAFHHLALLLSFSWEFLLLDIVISRKKYCSSLRSTNKTLKTSKFFFLWHVTWPSSLYLSAFFFLRNGT